MLPVLVHLLLSLVTLGLGLSLPGTRLLDFHPKDKKNSLQIITMTVAVLYLLEDMVG